MIAASAPGAVSVLEAHRITYADYLWAYATVKSRAAEAVVHGVAGTRLMAPGFDLFNHDAALAPGTTHRFDEARQCPGDFELDNLLLGKKRSDSLLSERAELARTWLAKHVCRTSSRTCGTSRRAKKFLEDYEGPAASSFSAMDVG